MFLMIANTTIWNHNSGGHKAHHCHKWTKATKSDTRVEPSSDQSGLN